MEQGGKDMPIEISKLDEFSNTNPGLQQSILNFMEEGYAYKADEIIVGLGLKYKPLNVRSALYVLIKKNKLEKKQISHKNTYFFKPGFTHLPIGGNKNVEQTSS
jgi:hypothetical protein